MANKAAEMLDKFPFELLLKIILSDDKTPSELLRLALVSKSWAELIYSKEVIQYILSKLTDNELKKILEKNCKAGLVLNFECLLLDKRVNVNAIIEESRTPLFYACSSEKENSKLVSFLLENGADVTLASLDGNTPLHQASLYGHTTICKLLLQYQPKKQIDACDKRGNTPLHYASSAEVVDVLMKHGAMHIRNKAKFYPLIDAIHNKNLPVVEALLKYIDVNEGIDFLRSTENVPLFLAMQTENIPMIGLLLKKGAGRKQSVQRWNP